MPRTGTVPLAGADAPYGSTAALDRLAKAVPPQAPGQGSPTPGLEQAQGTAVPVAPAQPSLGDHGDLNGGLDGVLFGPTDRPDESVFHGAPIGPGASFIPKPFEDDFTFMQRVSQTLKAAPAPKGAAVYITQLADRIARGE